MAAIRLSRSLDLRAQDELAGAEHPLEGGLELPFERKVLNVQIEQRNGHRTPRFGVLSAAAVVGRRRPIAAETLGPLS